MSNIIFKSDAIRNLYPTVKTISETEDGVITALDQDGNEVSIDMSAVNTKATELQTAETTATTTKATNKTNAIAKLKASTWLPLTDDEATALFGE